MNGQEYKIHGPLWCLLIVSELLISWSQCLRSLAPDSKLVKRSKSRAGDVSWSFSDNRLWSCCFSWEIAATRLRLLLGLAVMVCEGMSRKRIQRGAWPYFTFLFTSRFLKITAALCLGILAVTAALSRGSMWAKWRQYRIWLCFSQIHEEKSLILLRLISSVSHLIKLATQRGERLIVLKLSQATDQCISSLHCSFPSLLFEPVYRNTDKWAHLTTRKTILFAKINKSVSCLIYQVRKWQT